MFTYGGITDKRFLGSGEGKPALSRTANGKLEIYFQEEDGTMAEVVARWHKARMVFFLGGSNRACQMSRIHKVIHLDCIFIYR